MHDTSSLVFSFYQLWLVVRRGPYGPLIGFLGIAEHLCGMVLFVCCRICFYFVTLGRLLQYILLLSYYQVIFVLYCGEPWRL